MASPLSSLYVRLSLPILYDNAYLYLTRPARYAVGRAGSVASSRRVCYYGVMAAYRHLHEWNVTEAVARAIQNRLRAQVRAEPLNVGAIERVAGADISFDRGSETVFAGFVVLRLPTLE